MTATATAPAPPTATGATTAGAAPLARCVRFELVKLAAQFPRIVEAAALSHEPHRIAFYLGDMAAAFHGVWNAGNDDPERRFLQADRPQLTRARLALATAVGIIINAGLAIMGVSAAEEML